MGGVAWKRGIGWVARAAALLAVLVSNYQGLAADSEPKAGILARPAAGFDRVARETGLGERLIADCRDGRLDEFGLFEAALIASGVNGKSELRESLGMYRPVREQILANLPAGTAAERLKAIHAAVHRFVLTGYYDEAASDLRTALSSGDFNCLTSLVVCSDLCRTAGLNVPAKMVRGHVFLTMESSPGRVLRVEPGTPQWAARPLAEAGGDRSLTDVELLGKFYYNRGVQRLRAGQYAAGTALLRKSLILDVRDDDARMNLAAGLNNWAVEFCRDKRFGEAAALIDQGLAIDPEFAPLVANEQLVRGKLGK